MNLFISVLFIETNIMKNVILLCFYIILHQMKTLVFEVFLKHYFIQKCKIKFNMNKNE